MAAEKLDELLDRSLGASGKEKGGAAVAKDDEALDPYSKQEAVLRKLNRAQLKRRAAPKSTDDVKNRSGHDDPLSGLDDL